MQISERKKLHQHLMNRLKSQGKGALTEVGICTALLLVRDLHRSLVAVLT